MKSAKEWAEDLMTRQGFCLAEHPSLVELTATAIEAIQADAQAHGEAIGRVKGLREAIEAVEKCECEEFGSFGRRTKTRNELLNLARRLEAELTRDINNSPSQPGKVDLK